MRPWSFLPITSVLVGFALPLAGGLDAQTIPSPYTFVERRQEAGLFAGLVTAETGRFHLGPSGGTLLGGRYGLELSGPLGLEGAVGFMTGERDIVNPARVTDQTIGQADVILTTIDARLRFSLVGARAWHRLSPFLTFGGGLAFDIAADPELEADLEPADVFEFGTSFYGTLGTGTRWFLTDRFALRLEGLFSLWGIDTPPGFSDPDRGFENVEESEWMSGLSFAVSLLYRW
jgi:hypothetical protein